MIGNGNKRSAVITLLALAWLGSGCDATPLPIPPEMEPQRFALTEDTTAGQATFDGERAAANPDHRFSVQNITRLESPVEFSVASNGSFTVSLPGSLADNYRFWMENAGLWDHLFDCRSDGAGGVTVIADQDADGDTWPVDQDCDDVDPAVSPDAAEACADGLDNDCDGAVDAADTDCGCIPVAETCNGLDDDCDGEVDEGCPCTPVPEICDDGLDNDCDGAVDLADADCA